MEATLTGCFFFFRFCVCGGHRNVSPQAQGQADAPTDSLMDDDDSDATTDGVTKITQGRFYRVLPGFTGFGWIEGVDTIRDYGNVYSRRRNGITSRETLF